MPGPIVLHPDPEKPLRQCVSQFGPFQPALQTEHSLLPVHEPGAQLLPHASAMMDEHPNAEAQNSQAIAQFSPWCAASHFVSQLEPM